jgi:uncharacterized caspase-like protein
MLRTAFALLVLLLLASGAEAQKRVALVMGNSDYANISRLEKPVADARQLATLLRGMGFRVIVGTDLSKREMEKLLLKFRAVTEGAEFGFFHFSGHGFQSGSPFEGAKNHILPVDFRVPEAGEALETVLLDDIIQLFRERLRVGFISVDACRDDVRLAFASRRSGETIARGFAPPILNNLYPPYPRVGRSPIGLFFGYSTEPGKVAFEGENGPFSPYTTALVKHLPTPSINLWELSGRISEQVTTEMKNKQVPWFVQSHTAGAYVLMPRPAARSPRRSLPH